MTTKRNIKRILGVGAAAGMLFGFWRWAAARRGEGGLDWEPQSFPYPPRVKAPDTTADGRE